MVEITLLEVHFDDSELTATASTPFEPGEKAVAAGSEPPDPDVGSRAGTALGALLGLAFLAVVAYLARRRGLDADLPDDLAGRFDVAS
jgi:hypothetical protein